MREGVWLLVQRRLRLRRLLRVWAGRRCRRRLLVRRLLVRRLQVRRQQGLVLLLQAALVVEQQLYAVSRDEDL